MAKTNFAYEKRQRELEKKKKAEEKARRKAEAKAQPGLAEQELAETDSADDGEQQAAAGE
ncbi:hypothetical protein [Duganella qianjiadongensis]|uniref:Uncharacterized protein n=1 Tax=Duganella qianjiadongensis TaxID=2692176 RepID=A0ABW9VHT0_9BURK|nr:hypothetical protein [Duganella qianjiadongensis]MYM38757.1 hypothetical protein [Duganella qianjiadongensis]